jgi:TolB-like protein/Tfp pilus assembly protein PilF
VLPLQNLSGDPEQEYFADGMTEALITSLAKVSALKVIAPTAAMRYKNSDLSSAEIARELGVDAVVEGSALRDGDSVRIMTQLIDPETEQPLWAESYERDLENVLVLQGEVAQAIAGELEVALTPEDTKRLAGARPVNPEAHDAFLKGTYYRQTATREGLDTAERYFDLALEKDPSYAPAYAGLARVWRSREQMGYTPPHEAGPKAKALAERAVELDDGSAEAHRSLAAVRTWTEWDWAGAEPEWRRTLELNPEFADAHASFAHFLAITGRIEEALEHSERALELDPFSAKNHGFYAVVLCSDRRHDDAIAAARAALAIQPNQPQARGTLQYVLYSKGIRDEWLANQREWIARDPEFLAAFEEGLAEGGYEGAHRRMADFLVERVEKSGRVMARGFGPLDVASLYLFAGDYDSSFEWLEKAYAVHDSNLPYIGYVQTRWGPIRSDPRFQELLRKMNLPQAEVGS